MNAIGRERRSALGGNRFEEGGVQIDEGREIFCRQFSFRLDIWDEGEVLRTGRILLDNGGRKNNEVKRMLLRLLDHFADARLVLFEWHPARVVAEAMPHVVDPNAQEDKLRVVDEHVLIETLEHVGCFMSADASVNHVELVLGIVALQGIAEQRDVSVARVSGFGDAVADEDDRLDTIEQGREFGLFFHFLIGKAVASKTLPSILMAARASALGALSTAICAMAAFAPPRMTFLHLLDVDAFFPQYLKHVSKDSDTVGMTHHHQVSSGFAFSDVNDVWYGAGGDVLADDSDGLLGHGFLGLIGAGPDVVSGIGRVGYS